MALTIELHGKLFAQDVQEASGDMPIKWNNGLKNNASIINDRRLASVPDDGTFNTKMVIPSNAGFTPMLDAAFVSKSGRDATQIGLAQYNKLKKSFGKWNDALDYAFETVDGVVAKRYKDALDAKQGNWAVGVADTTLRVMGDKVRGRSVAPIAATLLSGDPRGMGMLRPADLWLTGKEVDVSRAGERSMAKQAFNQIIFTAAMRIIESEYLAAVITAQNAIMVTAFNGLIDAAVFEDAVTPLVPGSSFIAWEKLIDGRFCLELQVVKT